MDQTSSNRIACRDWQGAIAGGGREDADPGWEVGGGGGGGHPRGTE